MSRTEPIRHDPGWRAPQDPFLGNSTYGKDFIRHDAARREAIRPDNGPAGSKDPFDDRTGYKTDFIKHSMPERFSRPKEEYQINKVPLDGMTTMKRDFTPKDIERMRSFKPDGQGYRSDAPFDDGTTHKNDFKKWEVNPVFARKENDYRPPQGPMETSTNYNTEFTSKPAARAQPIRPASRKKLDVKFIGDTTYGQDFKKWAGDRVQPVRTAGEYQLPQVPFEGQSTYKTQYLPHSANATQSFKPDGNAYKSGAPFDGNTLYRMEFTPKEIAPCPAALIETNRTSLVLKETDERGHRFYETQNSQANKQIEINA
jgi:hypothetical protein